MSLDKFLRNVDNDKYLANFIAHCEIIPARKAKYATPSTELSENILAALREAGIDKLYKHQAQAIDLSEESKNVVVVTPTASGKSLLYNIPVLKSISETVDSHALYLFPLKALENDQAVKLKELISDAELDTTITVGIYDGDTPTNKRAAMRKNPPSVLITNPDMLQLSLLAYHSSWEDFFRGLKYVIIDELHVYRGVFGSHILHVLHRLDRLSRYYGSQVQYIATSATIAGA